MNQQIVHGLECLPDILRHTGCRRLFVVSGAHSFASCDYAGLIKSAGIEFVLFDKFTPNPLFHQVCSGVDLFLEHSCDCILAIGGGSPLDVAKCIKIAVIAKDGRDALIPPLVKTAADLIDSNIPLIAIPTTAGTGSESTHNAVIYYNGEKQTVTNDAVLPDYAILDSKVLHTLPFYQKACTMMDALCQSIESWWSVNSNEESSQYSRTAIGLIRDNWKKYTFEDDELAARNIMLASNYSGRAINIAQTTAAHAMSYKITSMYGLPHGHAVAICLPEIWQFMMENIDRCVDVRGIDYLSGVFQEIALCFGSSSPLEAIMDFRLILDEMNLGRPASENRDSDLSVLSKSVNPVRLKNNPVLIDEDAAYVLYDRILK